MPPSKLRWRYKKKQTIVYSQEVWFDYGVDEGMWVMVGNTAVNDSLLFFLTG